MSPATAKRVSTDKMAARTCRESYYAFVLEFWPTVIPERIKLNWHMRLVCDKLQTISERVFLDLPREEDFVCNCPPGTSKSSLFSVFWQPWVWTRMPSCRFISGSYAESLALDLSRKSRDVILSDKYRRYFPEIQLREDQNAKGYFANTKGGFRKAVGVGGVIIGSHAHIICIDDPIDPQGVLSDLTLRESNTWMTETLSRRKVDLQLTPTVLVMQRLHQDDPTGNWLERDRNSRRVTHWCLPCDTSWPVKPESFTQYYRDGLFDPVRLPRAALEESEKTLLEVGYACQYGQQPVPRGGAMFKVDKFVIKEPPGRLNTAELLARGWTRLNARGPWKRGPVRYWDKAATAGGGAYTAGVKMTLDWDDRVWVLDVVRGRWSSGERERRVLDTARLDGKQCRIGLEQEPGSGGKEAAELAARRYSLAGFRVSIDVVRASKEERAGNSPETRADSFSVQVNTGNVYLAPGAWNRDYVEELRYFPNSRLKDQVDASTGAYGMLTKRRLRIGAL